MTKMLIVLTSHTMIGDTGRPTGFHYEELAVPYWAFTDAGFEVDIASIQGGAGAHDPGSLKADVAQRTESVARFVGNPEAMAKLSATVPIASIKPEIYHGIFLPGGHGTMWDMPGSATLARIIGTLFDAGRVVGAVCHGPAGLVSAKRADGRSIVADRRVNSFTDAEEASINMTGTMPFLLESRLRELGGHFEGAANFQPFAVRDGNLVTGQNPASSSLVANHMIAAVRDAMAVQQAA